MIRGYDDGCMTVNLTGVKSVTALLLCTLAPTSWALDAIVLEADSVTGPVGLAGSRVSAQLNLADASHASVELHAAELKLTSASSALLRTGVRDFALQCGEVQASEPRFACQQLTLKFSGTPLGPQSLMGEVSYQSVVGQSAVGSIQAKLAPLQLAGGTLGLQLSGTPQSWNASVQSSGLRIKALRQFLQPWLQLPAIWSVDGQSQLQLQLAGNASQLRAAVAQVKLRDVGLQNDAGDIATEKLGLNLEVKLRGVPLDGASPAQFKLDASSNAGQALVGPVLADFAAAPLALVITGLWHDDHLEIQHLDYAQAGLVGLSGSGTLLLSANPGVERAELQIRELDFPAAYASFMQLSLAGTDFDSLQSQGSATGQFKVSNNHPISADLTLSALGFTDPAKKIGIGNLVGELHWRAAAADAVPSKLSWDSLGAYGLQSGSATLELTAAGDHLALTRAARIPVFDGALAIERFEASAVGSDDMQLDFAARIEPIGMPQLSRAFGWPEMQGSLAGEIPGLAYRNHTLSVAGDIKASVFGGTVVANKLVLQDPLGAWPKLNANFTARNLDLEQITRTFPIGSITGHLDADIGGLELFNWSPVAFDAHLFTTPDDKSKHRISQRAVTSISDIGGGGGGVAAALQSGFLKFFDDFGYARIGIRCQLRDDICLMSGIPRAGGGFYIVKGGGLPRIDIIGNAGRVGWSQLVSQINAALGSGNIVVQ